MVQESQSTIKECKDEAISGKNNFGFEYLSIVHRTTWENLKKPVSMVKKHG